LCLRFSGNCFFKFPFLFDFSSQSADRIVCGDVRRRSPRCGRYHNLGRTYLERYHGGMAGGNTGAAGNIMVDADGYLHLKITQSGSAWTCAEMFSADAMGSGPTAGRWTVRLIKWTRTSCSVCSLRAGKRHRRGRHQRNRHRVCPMGKFRMANGNYTVYPNSGTTVGEITFNFTLSGTYTTSSFVWTGSSIAYLSQEGFKAVGDNTGIIKTWTYAPPNPSVNIPQRAMPSV